MDVETDYECNGVGIGLPAARVGRHTKAARCIDAGAAQQFECIQPAAAINDTDLAVRPLPGHRKNADAVGLDVIGKFSKRIRVHRRE